MDKKLNNLIEFKESIKLDKLENKPGKIIEGLSNIKSFETMVDEGFFSDAGDRIRRVSGFKNKEEKFDEYEQIILNHPVKRKIYLELKDEDPNKAKKYIEFFVDNPQGFPKWSGSEWIDTAKYSHELLADVGAPSRQG